MVPKTKTKPKACAEPGDADEPRGRIKGAVHLRLGLRWGKLVLRL